MRHKQTCHEFYQAVLKFGRDTSLHNALELKDLKQLVFNEILSKSRDADYDSVTEFEIENSEDLIAEYDDDDYQTKIDDVIGHLAQMKVDVEVNFFKQDVVLGDDDSLEEVTSDIL